MQSIAWTVQQIEMIIECYFIYLLINWIIIDIISKNLKNKNQSFFCEFQVSNFLERQFLVYIGYNQRLLHWNIIRNVKQRCYYELYYYTGPSGSWGWSENYKAIKEWISAILFLKWNLVGRDIRIAGAV